MGDRSTWPPPIRRDIHSIIAECANPMLLSLWLSAVAMLYTSSGDGDRPTDMGPTTHGDRATNEGNVHSLLREHNNRWPVGTWGSLAGGGVRKVILKPYFGGRVGRQHRVLIPTA
jgi:hypothetical protein